MLTQKYRLSKKEIDQVKVSGAFCQGSFFALAYWSKKGGVSQFAFVISKRVSKKATARNRTRRLIAGSVRELISDLEPGYRVVFLVKASAISQNKETLALAIEESFKKIGLLRGEK